jgi:DNA-binding beta-propeller fold protein YncE
VKSHAKVPSVGSSSAAKLIALAIVALCAGLLAPTLASASRNLETSIPTGVGPTALAVDDSNGDIYVSEFLEETLSVSRFDSTGAAKNFTAGPNAGTNKLTGSFSFGPGASQVAVDSNSGRIYVTNLSAVEVFENTGEPLTSINGSSTPNHSYEASCGVAVDQSSGEVYVGDHAGFVWRYTPSGGSIEEANFSGGVSAPMPVCNVAAAQGIVYASDSLAAGEARAFKDSDFEATEPPPSPSSTLIDEGATAIYADSTNADLYVDKGSVIDVSDSSGTDLYSFGSGDFGSSSGVAVMPSPTGKAYVSDAEGEEVDVYGAPLPRSLETSIPTGVGPTALAVDDSNGDIYVSEFLEETLSVSRFDSTGAAKNFTAGPNAGTNKLTGSFSFGPGASQVAVDSNSGRIYVTNLSAVEVFENTGEPLTSINGSSTPNHSYEASCGVAVDQSSGEVYVGDHAGFVWRYTPSGGSIEEANFSGGVSAPMPVCNVAAAQGIVYASDSLAADEARAFKDSDFEATEPPPSPSSTLIDEGATAIYADSTNADLYVDKGSVIDVSDSSGTDLYSFGSGDFGSSSGVAVMPSPTGKAYVSDAEGEEVDVYGPRTGGLPTFELTIQKTGNGTGTVTSSPVAISCGLGCSAEFEEGKVVELEATADPDSEFTGWSTVTGDPGTCTGTTSPCEVTMNEAVELEAEFALKPPTVTEIFPDEGPLVGGNTITIVGTDLVDVEEIKFGATPANLASLVEVSPTEIEIDAPVHAVGTVDVIVTTEGGSSANTAADNYTYVEVPAVTGLNPTEGPTAGGTTLVIEGTDLANIEEVKFGNVPADLSSLVEVSSTEIEIEAPAHSAGTFAVLVTTPGDTSVDTPADDYTYIAPPAVTGLSPNKGPVAGGNEVEIIGTRLSEASQVEFGTTVVDDEEFIENTDTEIVVEAPAHEVGKVHVRVTTIGGISGKFSVDEYTFVGPASLTVSTAGTGSGSVTCDGGACAPTYAFGTEVTLAASASAGSTFGGWSGGGCAGTGPCVVTMEANTTVTATFNVIPPTSPSPLEECVVPKLKGKSLKNAKSALANANCKTGKVTRPKGKKGSLVVKSSKPGAGTTLPTDSKVDLTLGRKPKKRK